MPRSLLLVALISGVLLVGAASSNAQVVNDSTVSGTLVSRSATIPVGETRAAVLEVPNNGHFILTQACLSLFLQFFPGPFPTTTLPGFLVGSELGTVPLLSGCNSFEPGVAFSPGEEISCEISVATTRDSPCLVTGVSQPSDRGRGHRHRP